MTASCRNFRWCRQCQGMFYFSHPAGSVCPAGGQHDPQGSGNYTLYTEAPATTAQGGSYLCFNCQSVFYNGSGQANSVCPVGGTHNRPISRQYFMPHEAETGTQEGWRWCKKCQGLWYGGGSSSGVCPAGGAHSKEGSANYRVPASAATGWEEISYYIHSHLGDSDVDNLVLGTDDAAYAVLARKELRHRWIVSWREFGSTFWLKPVEDPLGYLQFHDSQYSLRAKCYNGSWTVSWFAVDVTSPGWVAINDYRHANVMDVRYGDKSPGTSVIAYPWNGGHNQIWCMAPYG